MIDNGPTIGDDNQQAQGYTNYRELYCGYMGMILLILYLMIAGRLRVDIVDSERGQKMMISPDQLVILIGSTNQGLAMIGRTGWLISPVVLRSITINSCDHR